MKHGKSNTLELIANRITRYIEIGRPV